MKSFAWLFLLRRPTVAESRVTRQIAEQDFPIGLVLITDEAKAQKKTSEGVFLVGRSLVGGGHSLLVFGHFAQCRDEGHVSLRNQTDVPVRKQRTVSDQDVFLHKVSYCYQELASYRNLLVQWQQQYAPQTPDEEPHPRFMEAIRNLEMVEYDLDLLQGGEEQEKMEIVKDFLWDEKEQREAISMEPIVKTPVYHQSAAYAREHGELEQYRQSHRANIDCKRDIEKTVSAHFDGMRLERKAAPEVIECFGAERVALVLAATVQTKSWDGRFSTANKDWAFSFDFPDPVNELGFDRRHDYAVETHPAVLDGFINLVRQEIRAMEHPLEKETATEAKEKLNPARPAKKKTHSMER